MQRWEEGKPMAVNALYTFLMDVWVPSILR